MNRHRITATAIFLCILFSSGFLWAKLRIDITNPQGILSIALPEFDGPYGAQIANIVKEDLLYTGLFNAVPNESFIEKSSEPFNRQNWAPIGAEAVLKGTASVEEKLSVVATLFDTSDGTQMLNKEYQASPSLFRQIAHSISNDIYNRITGQNGIFRTRIAFVGWEKEGKNIYIMDWDGQRLKKTGITGSAILAPHWSLDGSKLLYSAMRTGRWGIYMMDFTEQEERLVYSAKATIIAGNFFPSTDEFALSSSLAGTPDIYKYNFKKNELQRLTSTRGIEVSPSVSPDGSMIAFVSDIGGSPQVYLMDKDGGGITRLTFEGSYNTSPSWSPLGDRIVFVGRYEGKSHIYTINPDGGNLRRLTGLGGNEDPSFSQDGKCIVFTSNRDGERGIYLMRANGEAQMRITPHGLKASRPRWSAN